MKKHSLLTLFNLIFLLNWASCQELITWKTLEDVSFTDKYSDELASYIMIPTFGDNLHALEGKEVLIKGFVIPLDVSLNLYVLSANPYASCFFCGGAGPETVMDIVFAEKQKFRTDEYVTLMGRLKLNADDVYKLNYILEDAEIVKK